MFLPKRFLSLDVARPTDAVQRHLSSTQHLLSELEELAFNGYPVTLYDILQLQEDEDEVEEEDGTAQEYSGNELESIDAVASSQPAKVTSSQPAKTTSERSGFEPTQSEDERENTDEEDLLSSIKETGETREQRPFTAKPQGRMSRLSAVRSRKRSAKVLDGEKQNERLPSGQTSSFDHHHEVTDTRRVANDVCAPSPCLENVKLKTTTRNTTTNPRFVKSTFPAFLSEQPTSQTRNPPASTATVRTTESSQNRNERVFTTSKTQQSVKTFRNRNAGNKVRRTQKRNQPRKRQTKVSGSKAASVAEQCPTTFKATAQQRPLLAYQETQCKDTGQHALNRDMTKVSKVTNSSENTSQTSQSRQTITDTNRRSGVREQEVITGHPATSSISPEEEVNCVDSDNQREVKVTQHRSQLQAEKTTAGTFTAPEEAATAACNNKHEQLEGQGRKMTVVAETPQKNDDLHASLTNAPPELQDSFPCKLSETSESSTGVLDKQVVNAKSYNEDVSDVNLHEKSCMQVRAEVQESNRRSETDSLTSSSNEAAFVAGEDIGSQPASQDFTDKDTEHNDTTVEKTAEKYNCNVESDNSMFGKQAQIKTSFLSAPQPVARYHSCDSVEKPKCLEKAYFHYVSLVRKKNFVESVKMRQQIVMLILFKVKVDQGAIEKAASKLINDTRYLDAVLLYYIGTLLFKDVLSVKEQAKWLDRTSYNIGQVAEHIARFGRDHMELLESQIAPVIRTLFSDIERCYSVDARTRCVYRAHCLNYIEAVHHFSGNEQRREQVLCELLTLMRKCLGDDASKYKVYGYALNNLGRIYCQTSRYNKSVQVCREAVKALTLAEDFESSEEYNEHLALAETFLDRLISNINALRMLNEQDEAHISVETGQTNIEHGGMRLELPDNALDADISLAVSMLFNEADEKTPGITPILKCGPIGHRFKRPVSMTLPTAFIERREDRDVRVRIEHSDDGVRWDELSNMRLTDSQKLNFAIEKLEFYRGFVESVEVKMTLERVKVITCHKNPSKRTISWKIADNVLPTDSQQEGELLMDETFIVSFKHRYVSLALANEFYQLLPNKSQEIGDVFTRPKAQVHFAYVRKSGGTNVVADLFNYKIKSARNVVHENTFFLGEFQSQSQQQPAAQSVGVAGYSVKKAINAPIGANRVKYVTNNNITNVYTNGTNSTNTSTANVESSDNLAEQNSVQQMRQEQTPLRGEQQAEGIPSTKEQNAEGNAQQVIPERNSPGKQNLEDEEDCVEQLQASTSRTLRSAEPPEGDRDDVDFYPGNIEQELLYDNKVY